MVGADVEATYVTAQAPPESVHVGAGEKFPNPALVHVTVPVGELPDIVAVHVEEAPSVRDEGEQVTDVVVVALTLDDEVDEVVVEMDDEEVDEVAT